MAVGKSERGLMDRLADMAKESLQRIGPEIGAAVMHQGGRGSTELANALFDKRRPIAERRWATSR
jgi:hypothetical protein